MENNGPFQSCFSLRELPDFREEVLHACHFQINNASYLNVAFERVCNIARESICFNSSLLLNSVHPDNNATANKKFRDKLQKYSDKKNFIYKYFIMIW